MRGVLAPEPPEFGVNKHLPMLRREFWLFTLWPVWRGLKGWNAMSIKNLISTRRAHVSLAVFFGVLILGALPLNCSVSVPAVFLPAQEAWIYPPEPSRVMQFYVVAGQSVHAGDKLVQLYSPEIGRKQELATLHLALVQAKLSHIAADNRDFVQSIILQQQRQTLVDELNGLAKREAKLELRAPISGVVVDAIVGAVQGVWLGRDNLLMHVVAQQGAVFAGLANERDQARLHIGQQAVFVSENGDEAALEATLSEISAPGSEGIEYGYLSSLHGGAVAIAQEGGRSVPVSGVLPIRFNADMPAPLRAVRGTLTVSAESTSFLALSFGRLVSVFLRESGF